MTNAPKKQGSTSIIGEKQTRYSLQPGAGTSVKPSTPKPVPPPKKK